MQSIIINAIYVILFSQIKSYQTLSPCFSLRTNNGYHVNCMSVDKSSPKSIKERVSVSLTVILSLFQNE